jgi:hypothetical protein
MPVKIPTSLTGQVKKWLKARQALADAEEEKRAMQPYIEKALEKAPDHRKKFGVVTLSLIEVQQKRLDEKAAAAALGAPVLEPFYKDSSYKKILVK